jgi:hypothetical protein
MGLTTDPKDPRLREHQPDGQQVAYLVLSEEERAKGFVMPVYRSYRHMKCGCDTHMGLALCETYARNPKFYGGTMCVHCGTHFDLFSYVEAPLDAADIACGRVLHKQAAFYWVEANGDRVIPVGATPEEAQALWEEKRRKEAEKHIGGGI